MNIRKTHLILTALSIFITKSLLAFLHKGLTILPDEACILLKAQHLAETFNLTSCQAIAQTTAGNPAPLTSVLIAPLHTFLEPFAAYQASLILNALLITSLTFPIYHLIKIFLKSDKAALFTTVLILFLPQIVAFEHTTMSETLFISLNTWILYFYANSHSSSKNKLIAFLLAIAAIFTRPFGFITLFSLIINEIIINKHKIRNALIAIPIISLILVLTATPEILTPLTETLQRASLITATKSILFQINSFTIALLAIPLIIFLSQFFAKQPKQFQKFKYFLLIFIVLNFIISAEQILEYQVQGLTQDLSTRYINSSLIFIAIFGLTWLQTTPKFRNFTIPTILILLLAFQPQLNITNWSLLHDQTHLLTYQLYFPTLIIVAILTLLLLLNQKRLTIAALAILIISSSTLLSYTHIQASKIHTESPLFQELKDQNNNIIFNQHSHLATFWTLQALTKNKLSFSEDPTNFDLIISRTPLPFQLIKTYPSGFTIYKPN